MTNVGAPFDPAHPFDPPAPHEGTRITTLYATACSLPPDRAIHGTPAVDVFAFSRLASFYRTSQDQLPHVLLRHDIDPDTLRFRRWNGHLTAAQVWLFTLPSGQIIVGLTLDLTDTPVQSIPLLEDLYYVEAELDGHPFQAWCHTLATTINDCTLKGNPEFLPERHQLVFSAVAHPSELPSRDQLQRIIYRADLSTRSEDSSIRAPGELNRRDNSTAALGPFVSVIAGHQGYLENSVLLSAVQIVGSAARLRDIRERAYQCVRTFRTHLDDTLPERERRLVFEDIADELGELELELSFSVEATADLGLLIPSLRVESYHDALYESMNLARRTRTTSHMLDRLRNAIDSELTAVTSIEDRIDDDRRVRTVAAVTFVSTVGGTLAILFGFFGINASEVDPSISMFDFEYLPIYLLIAGVVVVALCLYLVLGWRRRLNALK
ncbi:MAG: hypothetical protein QG608_1967 [Actinomycetota bacterium]|nr:hypothetical protein [Actinomycetota bacterium]